MNKMVIMIILQSQRPRFDSYSAQENEYLCLWFAAASRPQSHMQFLEKLHNYFYLLLTLSHCFWNKLNRWLKSIYAVTTLKNNDNYIFCCVSEHTPTNLNNHTPLQHYIFRTQLLAKMTWGWGFCKVITEKLQTKLNKWINVSVIQ